MKHQKSLIIFNFSDNGDFKKLKNKDQLILGIFTASLILFTKQEIEILVNVKKKNILSSLHNSIRSKYLKPKRIVNPKLKQSAIVNRFLAEKNLLRFIFFNFILLHYNILLFFLF